MRVNSFYYLVLLLILTCLFCCIGCEDSVKFSNQPPGNLSITNNKCYIWTEGVLDLVGDATDTDGDPLIFRWSASGGTFDSNEGKTVRWTAPGDPGTYTVTLTVTDEIDDRSTSISISVGALFPSLQSVTTIEDEGYPYIVIGSSRMFISAGRVVILEPGVQIIIDSPFGGFNVAGRLIANGTKERPIEIYPNSCEEGTGLWEGVAFTGYQAEKNGILRNVYVLAAKNGIEVVAMAQITLDSCTVYNSSIEGVRVIDNSAATITDCIIINNGVGMYVKNSNVSIQSSVIRENGNYGIQISNTDEFTSSIENCVISYNGSDGILLTNFASPTIHYCSMSWNGGYEIRLDYVYEATDSVQAQNNYWGCSDCLEADISALVFDKNDEVSIGAYIDFDPWLNNAPVGFVWQVTPR